MMIGIIVLAVFSLPLVACLPLNATETTLQRQAKQQNISCLFQEDRDTRATFYTAVRAKHGFQDTPVRSLRPKVFRSASVRCFSQRQCPDESEVTWCFNLYHPSKCIEVCWDSSNNIINMTEDAAALNISQFLAVTDSCLFSGGDSCVELQDTPFFLSGGLLTCTAQTSECVHKSFISITVEYAGLSNTAPEIQLLSSSSELVLGEQNVYQLSVQYPTDPIDFFFGFSDGLMAYVNNVPVTMAIPQNGPFCELIEDCEAAGSQFDVIRNERVRFYSSMTTERGCPATSRTFTSWLVIDDARQSDAAVDYRFATSAYVYDPFPRPAIVFNHFNLDLIPVDKDQSSGNGAEIML